MFVWCGKHAPDNRTNSISNPKVYQFLPQCRTTQCPGRIPRHPRFHRKPHQVNGKRRSAQHRWRLLRHNTQTYPKNRPIHKTLTTPHPKQRYIGKFLGIDYALLPNREWNQKQKHKKQPWSNVECFAFGGATVRFASLETSFHAANHTIPPPPSYEGLPLWPKDKNLSPFHGEKPLIIK